MVLREEVGALGQPGRGCAGERSTALARSSTADPGARVMLLLLKRYPVDTTQWPPQKAQAAVIASQALASTPQAYCDLVLRFQRGG